MMARSSLLLALAATASGAKQDCGVAIWWGGLVNPSQDDCSGDPLIEGGSCVEALNTLLKAAPTSAVGTVTQLITGQDAASLAFKTATGRDVPTYCNDVCTQSCYSGFWFNSPCILDEGAMRCAAPLCLCAASCGFCRGCDSRPRQNPQLANLPARLPPLDGSIATDRSLLNRMC